MNRLLRYLAACRPSSEMERLFDNRESDLNLTTSEHQLETIVWECTRRCDLQCMHCGTPYNEHTKEANELDTSQAKEMFFKLDKAFTLEGLTCVSITGGEPVVRNDLVEMVKHIHSFGVPQIVTHTNGHRLSRKPRLAHSLVQAGITGIGINIDGMQENHNWLRRDPDAFGCSLTALRLAKDAGADTMVSTVITRRVIKDLPAIRELLREVRPNRWRLLPVEPIGRAPKALKNDLLQPKDLADVLSFVLECQTEDLPFGVEMGCGQWYGKKLEGLVRPYIWYCIAGVNVLGIMSDGSIGACNNIDRSFCRGNILTDDVKEVWENRFGTFRKRDWAETDECKGCSGWNLCKGGEMHMRDDHRRRLSSCFFKWLEMQSQATSDSKGGSVG